MFQQMEVTSALMQGGYQFKKNKQKKVVYIPFGYNLVQPGSDELREKHAGFFFCCFGSASN